MTRTPTLTASIHLQHDFTLVTSIRLQDDFTLVTDIWPSNGAACIEVGGLLHLFIYDPQFAFKLASALTDVAAKMRVGSLTDRLRWPKEDK